MVAYTEATQDKIRAAYASKNLENRAAVLNTGETIYEAPRDYLGSHYDHLRNFAEAIRGKRKIVQDPTFGLRAAGAALLANESYYKEKPVAWDPEAMKLV